MCRECGEPEPEPEPALTAPASVVSPDALAATSPRILPPAHLQPVDRTGPTRLEASGDIVLLRRPALVPGTTRFATTWRFLAAPEWSQATSPWNG